MKKQKLMRCKLGLVLTEALVAMATLTTGVIALSTIINNAISTLAVSRDYMIAQNLATEGIEAVKAVRDSNWLLFPTNKECWLYLDPYSAAVKLSANQSVSCSGAASPEMSYEKVSSTGKVTYYGKNYAPFVDGSDAWKLVNVTSGYSYGDGALDLENSSFNQEKFIILIKDLGLGKFMYISKPSGNPPADTTNSKFYRSIIFKEIDKTTHTKATFEVKVQWLEGAKVRTILRESTLYNYL